MKLAFVFPGQGSQKVGMLAPFAGDAAVDDVVRRASAALGQDLAALIGAGPAEELNLTVNTQPAMLVAGIATYAAWRGAGGAAPAVVAGHSLGEYTALTAAGAFDLDDAVRLVRFRAEAMQAAVPVGVGAMAAILGLDAAEVARACREAADGEVVEPVNFNEPTQTVIAGHRDAVERACERAKALGAKRAVALAVSAPFHSRLMQPAADALRVRLAATKLVAPTIAVINNIDVAVERDPERIRDALARQAAGPVRWVEIVRAMVAQGVTHVVECGPGRVLIGTAKRIAPALECVALSDPAAIAAALSGPLAGAFVGKSVDEIVAKKETIGG